jgi:hypothetical protein
LKFKLHNIYNTNQQARISFKLPNYIVSYCLNNIATTMTLGVSQTLPLTGISPRDMEGVVALTGTANSRIFNHYGNTKSRW